MLLLDNQRGYIYGLFDPRESIWAWDCRYIGQTRRTTRERLRGQINDAKNGGTRHISNWIRQILVDGLEPIIRVFEEPLIDDLNDREIFWIAKGRELGWRLTNIHNGGNASLHPEETRRKISESRLALGWTPSPEHLEAVRQSRIGATPWNKGLTDVISDETREKIRAARALQTFSDETRQKISDAGRGRVLTEEHKAKISESHKGIVPSPEVRAKISATLTGRKNGPHSEEHRAKISAANRGRVISDEWRSNMSDAANERWSQPGACEAYSELMSEVMADPNIRQRVSDGQKSRYAASDKSPMDCPDCGKGPFKGEWGLAAHKQFCKASDDVS